MGNRFGEGLALNNMGVVALTLGSLDEGAGYLNRALAIRVSMGDSAGRATTLRNLGILGLMKGDLEQAQGQFQQALDVAQGTGIHTIEAECRFCLGELHRLRQRYRPAMEEYRQAAELLAAGATPRVRAAALAGLAECEARQGPAVRRREARLRLEGLDKACADSPYVHRAWAWVHFLSGERARALECLEKAKADPTRMAPEIQKELASTQEWMGRRP
jgi:tetratricopeptide (TPR) repeat protein